MYAALHASPTTTGISVPTLPDATSFDSHTFYYTTIEDRIRELAFLNRGLTLRLTDDRAGKEVLLRSEGGLIEFVQYLNTSATPLHPIIHIRKVEEGVLIEAALQYTAGHEEGRVLCFTNNVYNPDGGTHLSGFRAALTRTMNAYGTRQELFKG